MISIPLTIAARNEARAIGPCLDSVLAAIRYAQARAPLRIDPLVVLDDCTDGTGAIARARGVPCAHGSGGKVAAQRRGHRPGPFQIFCDADVLVAEPTLHALCEVMRTSPDVRIAFPPKTPLPPRRRSPLAWALHVYNLRRGFSSQRTWFSGKLFAIRGWEEAMDEGLASSTGMRVDDIWLSRWAVRHGGPGALRETAEGEVRFRAPETWRGMYRYYRRMRMELERLDRLFPHTRPVHRRYGRRRADLLADAPLREWLAWVIFGFALAGCRAAYVAERLSSRWMSRAPCDPWPTIDETKELPFDSGPNA